MIGWVYLVVLLVVIAVAIVAMAMLAGEVCPKCYPVGATPSGGKLAA